MKSIKFVALLPSFYVSKKFRMYLKLLEDHGVAVELKRVPEKKL